MDYGGNSIGVGLVTWGFFSPARHQPPDHETADREATSSAQKYSQTIATTIECSEIFSNYNCEHNHDVGEAANPWSHSYLAMDTICPILAPLREEGEEWDTTPQGREPLVQVQLDLLCVRQPSICSLACQRMLFEWQWTKVASPAGVEAAAAACCWSV